MGILADLTLSTLCFAVAITVFAGLVKGVVGFGLPLIMISGLATFLPAEVALAALILPTASTNIRQALRQGARPAWEVMRKYRIYLLALFVTLVFSAQLVLYMPQRLLFILIGVPVVMFCLMQLRGWVPTLRPENRVRDESIIASISGLVGGISGVWGPPLVAYLTATNTQKTEQMLAQGVVYGFGAMVLVGAHMQSGVFNAYTAPLSAAMLIPAFLGMALGYRLHDRMPQKTFKRATLIVLTVAGLNLIRRGLTG